VGVTLKLCWPGNATRVEVPSLSALFSDNAAPEATSEETCGRFQLWPCEVGRSSQSLMIESYSLSRRITSLLKPGGVVNPPAQLVASPAALDSATWVRRNARI
jgi:hypothetical protein